MTLPVSEIFGPTWQGEGPALGRRCGFMRLGGCNLTCEWCDTPYTWDASRFDLAKECPPRAVCDIVAKIQQMDVGFVVLTGGEPLLHVKNPDLRAVMEQSDVKWHVETNGTIPPPAWMDAFFVVSPKVSTRDRIERRINPRALSVFATLAHQNRAIFKFVARDAEDVQLAGDLVTDLGILPSSVYIMAEGTTSDAVLSTQRAIAPAVMRCGLNLTTRLHVLLWNDEKGR